MTEVDAIPRVNGPEEYAVIREEHDKQSTVEEVTYGAWTPSAPDLSSGFCSTKACRDIAIAEAASEVDTVPPTTGMCVADASILIQQAPIYTTQELKRIAQRKWPPAAAEPYAFARPQESGDDMDETRKRIFKERFNYAKALLRSDYELEKLARKIRSEIHQSEMFELAVEAERAANAGLSSFSARPSTFGLDSVRAGKKQPLPLRRNQTFTDGSNSLIASHEEGRKVRLLELRNVDDVFPQWKELHAHMRTHLFRQDVVESSLVFREVFNKEEFGNNGGPSLETPSSDIGRSFRLFADQTMTRLRNTRDMLHPRTTSDAHRMDITVDEESQTSGPLGHDQFGATLSSHLLPKNSTNMRRPPICIPPGLSHPDEGRETRVVPPSGEGSSFSPELPGSPQVKHPLTDSFYNAKPLERTPENSSTCPNNCTDTTSEPQGSPIALLDVTDDEDSVASHSPIRDPEIEHNISIISLIDEQPPESPLNALSQRVGFATPARLRDLSGRRGGRVRDMPKREEIVSTPPGVNVSMGYEPSSIIDHHQHLHQQETEYDSRSAAPLADQDADFLALPLIHDTSQKSHRFRVNHLPRRVLEYNKRHTLSLPLEWSQATQDHLFSEDPIRDNTDPVSESYVTESSPLQTREPITTLRTSNSPRTVHLSDSPEVIANSIPGGSPKFNQELVDIWLKQNRTLNSKYVGPTNCYHDRDEIKKRPNGLGLRRIEDTSGLCHYGMPERTPPKGNGQAPTAQEMLPSPHSPLLSDSNHNGTHEGAVLERYAQHRHGMRRIRSCPHFASPEHPDRTMSMTEINYTDMTNNNASDQTNNCTNNMTGELSSSSGRLTTTNRSSSHYDHHPGMCHSFSLPDENIQIAMEEMMARFSPIPTSTTTTTMLRPRAYLSVKENKEFLSNYFYCAKINRDSGTSLNRELDQQGQQHEDYMSCYGGESFCLNLGADSFMSNLQFLLPSQSGGLRRRQRSRPSLSRPIRQRSVSLDCHGASSSSSFYPPPTSPYGWLGDALERTISNIGTQLWPSAPAESSTSVEFDPPCLKKAVEMGRSRLE